MSGRSCMRVCVSVRGERWTFGRPLRLTRVRPVARWSRLRSMRARATAFLLVAAVLPGCSCVPAADTDADSGTDSGSDGGTDTGSDGDVDAAVWQPSFEPRIIYRDESVRCAPAVYEHTLAPRDPSGVGQTVFHTRIGDDEHLARNLLELVGRDASLSPRDQLTMTAAGGVVGTFGPGVLIEVGPLGEFVGYRAAGAVSRIDGAQAYPSWSLVLAPSSDVWVPLSELTRVRFDAGSSVVTTMELPSVVSPPTDERYREQSPTVARDGTIAWAYGSRYIVGSCDDGRPRWILETDPAPITDDTESGYAGALDFPRFIALNDGTFLAHTNLQVLRIGPDGEYLGGWYAQSDIGYVDGCGVYTGAVVRRPSGAREARIEQRTVNGDLIGAFVYSPGQVSVTPMEDCSIVTFAFGDVSFVLARRSIDGSLRWSVDLDRSYQILPGSDGDLIALGLDLTVSRVDGETGAFLSSHSVDGFGESAYAQLLRPDGVMVVVGLDTESGASLPYFIGVDLGLAPGPTYRARRGQTWASNGAAWMLGD